MNKLKLAALLALAGTGIYTQSAQAAFTYTQGDVLIGFRSTNGSITTDYLIDLGQTLFSQAALHGGTITIGNFNTDLNSFDASWFTDGTVLWGVGGATLSGDSSRTLYAGYAENAVNPTPGATYTGQASGAQQTQLGKYNSVGNNAALGGAILGGGSQVGDTGGNNFTGLEVQSQSASNANSWATLVNGSGAGFAHFAGFEGAVGPGSTGNNLDYYRIQTLTSPSLQGTFHMASDGTLTFSTVPEPSALITLVGGAGLLVLIRRRRSAIA